MQRGAAIAVGIHICTCLARLCCLMQRHCRDLRGENEEHGPVVTANVHIPCTSCPDSGDNARIVNLMSGSCSAPFGAAAAAAAATPATQPHASGAYGEGCPPCCARGSKPAEGCAWVATPALQSRELQARKSGLPFTLPGHAGSRVREPYYSAYIALRAIPSSRGTLTRALAMALGQQCSLESCAQPSWLFRPARCCASEERH